MHRQLVLCIFAVFRIAAVRCHSAALCFTQPAFVLFDDHSIIAVIGSGWDQDKSLSFRTSCILSTIADIIQIL